MKKIDWHEEYMNDTFLSDLITRCIGWYTDRNRQQIRSGTWEKIDPKNIEVTLTINGRSLNPIKVFDDIKLAMDQKYQKKYENEIFKIIKKLTKKEPSILHHYEIADNNE